MKRTIRTIGGVACMVTLVACSGGLDMDKVKALISELITKQVGASVKSVTCPEQRETKAGDSFECTAEIDHGKVPVTVTQKDGDGTVSAELKQAILKVGELEKLIAGNIKESTGDDATVSCGPKFRPSTPNETFDCTAKTPDADVKIKVTVKDDQGNVRFEAVSDEEEDQE
ncbi:MAG: DUF4333 domain-containing protein [Vicinamibacteria bacterium]|nr:DUF4333 domain-containing protein [Vicinamibacteria bacterium]